MKKFNFLALASLIVLTLSYSCRKEHEGVTITKVINVSINANENYTYDIPHAGDADDVMQISKQAAHFLTSKLTTASGGNALFEYTPQLNYSGTDEVVVNNVEGGHSQGGHGNCQGSGRHHDDTIVYDFKITINGTTNRSRN